MAEPPNSPPSTETNDAPADESPTSTTGSLDFHSIYSEVEVSPGCHRPDEHDEMWSAVEGSITPKSGVEGQVTDVADVLMDDIQAGTEGNKKSMAMEEPLPMSKDVQSGHDNIQDGSPSLDEAELGDSPEVPVEQQQVSEQDEAGSGSVSSEHEVPCAGRLVSQATTGLPEDEEEHVQEEVASSSNSFSGPTQPPSPASGAVAEVFEAVVSQSIMHAIDASPADPATSSPCKDAEHEDTAIAPAAPAATVVAAAAAAASSASTPSPLASCAPAATSARKQIKYDSDSEKEFDVGISSHQRARLDLVRVKKLQEAAQPTVNEVRGKLVNLVLGRTSAGKSALLQVLSGRKLRPKIYSAMKTVFEVDGDADPDFEIGHESKSKTTMVKHLSLNSTRAQEKVVYVDSPGSLDTRGAEINIATALSFQQIAQNCRALRLVVLVSCATFENNRADDLRSSLDFIRNFVANWKKSRLAFSFLFTHTEFLNCTSEVACSVVPQLRQRLRQRLAESLNFTDELRSSTRAVLEWLVKCLDNEWWHKVDVFHPTESNMEEWRLEAETFEVEEDPDGKSTYHAIGIRPGEECSSVFRCNLDEVSVAKMEVELDFMLTFVNQCLQSHEYNRLADQIEVLVYLNTNMSSLSSMKKTTQRIVNGIAGHASSLAKEAESIISSSLDLEARDVLSTDLRKALEHLAAADFLYRLPLRKLSDGSDIDIGGSEVEEAAESLMTGLKSFLVEIRSSLGSAVSADPAGDGVGNVPKPVGAERFQQLKRLSFWAEASSTNPFAGVDLEMANEGAVILRSYVQHLLTLVREKLTSTKIAKIAKMGFGELCRWRVSALARLCEVGLGAGELSGHAGEVSTEANRMEQLLQEEWQELVGKTTKTLEDGMAGVRSIMEKQSGQRCADNSVEATFNSAREDVGKLLHLAAAVEREKFALASLHSTCQQGLAAVDDLAAALVHELAGSVRNVLQAVPSNGPLPDVAANLASLLSSLKMALNQIEGSVSLRSGHKSKAVLTQYLDDVDVLTKRWESKLASMWGEASVPEMKTIHEQVELLATLSKITWKQRYVSSPSMSSSVADLLPKYSNFVLERSRQVLEGMENFLKTPTCPSKRDHLVRTLTDRRKLQVFSQVCPTLVDDLAEMEKGLLERLAIWKEELLPQTSSDTISLASVLAQPTSQFFKDIEAVFHVWDALGNLGGMQTKIEALHKKAGQRLDWLKKEIGALLRADGDYESKKLVLEALSSWDPSKEGQEGASASFAHVCAALPRSDDVVCQLRKEVDRRSKEIQDLIAVEKLDHATEALESLKPALCLDVFLRDMAKHELESLKQRLDLRRSDLDTAWKARINACDFEGTRQKFEDMVNSESSLEKQKTKEMWEHISVRVEAFASQAEANVQDGEVARSAILKLQRAIFELDPLLDKFKTLNIQRMVESLEQRVNNTFEDIIAAFKSAYRASKLPEALTQQQLMISYHGTTRLWLKASLSEEAAQALASVANCFDSADHLANCFVKNLNLEPKDRTDTSELLFMLDQLADLTHSASTMKEGPSMASNEADVIRKRWVVVGGLNQGGIGVRADSSTTAKMLDGLLGHASVVTELDQVGNYLKYQLEKGTGPSCGWIPLMIDQRESVCPVSGVRIVTSPVAARPKVDANSPSLGDLPPGAFVRVLKEERGQVNFKKLSDHPGPQQGWAALLQGEQVNFGTITTERPGHTDLKPAIDLHQAGMTYNRLVQELVTQLTKVRNQCRLPSPDPRVVARVRCLYPYLISEFQKGLAKHVRLDFCLETELEQAEKQHSKRKSRLSNVYSSEQEMQKAWSEILSHWEGLSRVWNFFWQRSAYSSDMDDLVEQAECTVKAAVDALRNGEYPRCRNQSKVALSMQSLLTDHKHALGKVEIASWGLKEKVVQEATKLVQDLLQALRSNNTSEFERLFYRLHKLVKQLRDPFPGILESLPILHEGLFQHVISKVGSLDDVIQKFHLQKVKQSVQTLRDFGHVLVSIWPVYAESVSDASQSDHSFQQLKAICSQYFSSRAFGLYGPHYAALEIGPNASKKDVERAGRLRSRECHPDKHLGQGAPGQSFDDSEQKQVNNAKSALGDPQARQAYQQALKGLFSSRLREIPHKMQDAVEIRLTAGDYGAARSILGATRDLQLISALVEPALDIGFWTSKIEQTAKQHLDELCNDIWTFWSNRELKQLHSCLERLQRVDSTFSGHSNIYSPGCNRRIREEVRASIDTEAEKLSQKICKMAADGEDRLRMYQIAEGLLWLGSIQDELALFKDFAASSISHLLAQCQDELGPKLIFRIGLLLGQGAIGESDADGDICAERKRVGLAMLESFRQFKDNLTQIFNQQTSTQRNIENVLEGVKTQKVAAGGQTSEEMTSVDPLREGFLAYEARYEEWLKLFKVGGLQLEAVKKEVEGIAAKARPLSVHRWTAEFRHELPKILAGIAAYFTMSKAGNIASAAGVDGGDADILPRPHTIQILAILILFGYNSSDASLARQLVQIRTGEGKSMILGMSSLLFALLGFRVHCICYSKFLSERDHKLFRDMFKAFQVEPRVRYSTIRAFKGTKVAEKGDIQQLTTHLVEGGLPPASSCSQARHRLKIKRSEEILLVDEVDMFFGPDFYGDTYNLAALLHAQEVVEILRMIWRHRALHWQLLVSTVLASSAFQCLSRRFPGFDWLLKCEVRSMCQAVRAFNPNDHCFDKRSNTIGYKEFDSINFHLMHGYTTAFAYLYEAEQGRLQDPERVLQQKLRLLIYCGNFCYSSIDADCILGVSGTLEALGDEEWKIMRKYGIDRYSVMPSVYGEYNFSWKTQNGIHALLTVRSRDDQFVQITDQIKKLVVANRRAVIVVFETLELLRQYASSSYASQVQEKNLLTEDMPEDKKEFVIRKAATSRQVTLTTKAFGRGMDFMCHDDRLTKAGGTHLIATFFPLDRSEEKQIQGRIARQGKPGSYSMLLCEPDLQTTLGWQPAFASLLASTDELYQSLEAQRAKRLREQYKRIESKLEGAEKDEAMSQAYFDALLAGDAPKATQLLQEYYRHVYPFNMS